ncbi:unnamed protein product [Phytomonas sp. Hart1]|nr:unnamed protein product [Phytomonas sp. Hart1]|eukprot:CCW67695.1 unnamed protein product [Phytomonas sp. isolate Hart1]
MGKNSAFVKAHTQDLRRRRAQRSQRSKVERGKRLAQGDRRIQRVAKQWALPTEENTSLLLTQFTQACRLPNTSAGLCALIRHYAGTDEKAPLRALEPLTQMAEMLLQAQDVPMDDLGEEEDKPAGALSTETVLQDILQTECGGRVVTMLLSALQSTEIGKSVAKAILEQFEATEALVTHHVACRVLTALVQWGPMEVKCGVLEMLRERGGIESAFDLLVDRHTATTIVQLLEHLPMETSVWLVEELGLSEEGFVDTKASMNATSCKGKENEEFAEVDKDESQERFRNLIEHPVSWRILAQLAINMPIEKRLRFLDMISFAELCQTKRGTRFLGTLISADSSTEKNITSTASAAIMQVLGKIVEESASLIQDMSISPYGNFLVQKLIQVVLLVRGDNDKNALELFSRIVHVLTHNGDPATTHSLASHPIGVHVICTLIDTALLLIGSNSGSGNKNYRVVEEIVSFLTLPKHVANAICDQYDSLLVRRLMPLLKQKQSNLGKMLASTIEQTMSSLLYDPIGNLVVQEYFQVIGPDAASKFTSKLMEEEILAMCRSPFASHVLFTLLDVINPAARVSLCSTLKPHVLAIATHVNGRFIVERLVASSREVRDELVRQFYALAREKGTQHVLCSLVSHLDPRGKTHVIEKIIVPRLFELATHSCGSIVLQKLMQSDAGIAAAVKKRIAQEKTLRNDLAQNFYGKFVVQIAEN